MVDLLFTHYYRYLQWYNSYSPGHNADCAGTMDNIRCGTLWQTGAQMFFVVSQVMLAIDVPIGCSAVIFHSSQT